MSARSVRSALLRTMLSCCLLAVAQGDKRAAGGVLAPARASPHGSSGRFVSPERHACSWQLTQPALEPPARSELAVRCQGADGTRRQCVYRGEPARCAAYTARPAHYWKQVLAALRRKPRPCLDAAPLKARLCAGRKGHGAELRLVPHGSPPAGPTAASFPGELKPRARSRGTPRSPAPGLASGVPPPRPSGPQVKHPGKNKAGGGKRKVPWDVEEERPLGTGLGRDGLDGNAKLTETYCTEKWHSLCNFFVNFWNG